MRKAEWLKKATLITAVTMVLTAMQASAQKAGTVKGVWQAVEVVTADGTVVKDPQPNLYVFTDKYYSQMAVTGSTKRPVFEQNKATDAQKIASFDAFLAQSGTYELSGSALTRHVVVAKNEGVMAGPPLKSEVSFQGAILIVKPAPGATGNTVKMKRLE